MHYVLPSSRQSTYINGHFSASTFVSSFPFVNFSIISLLIFFLFISVWSHIYLFYTLDYDLVFCYFIIKLVSYLTFGGFFSWLHNHCRIWGFWGFPSFLAQASPCLYIPMFQSLNQPLLLRVLVPFIVEWYYAFLLRYNWF